MDLLVAAEGEDLVELGPVDKFELDPVGFRAVTSLVIHITATTSSTGIALEEIDRQVTRAERNDEAVFENQRNIESNKSAGAFTEVANVILSIGHVVLYDHVAVAYAVVLVLLDHEVIVDVALA